MNARDARSSRAVAQRVPWPAAARPDVQQGRKNEERSTERKDLAAHCQVAEGLERLVVGKQERSVPYRGRETAQRDRSAAPANGHRDVSTEQARAIEDVERVLTPDPERDGQCDEVEKIEL